MDNQIKANMLLVPTITILALFAPFSFAIDNIFTDGTVVTSPPKIDQSRPCISSVAGLGTVGYSPNVDGCYDPLKQAYLDRFQTTGYGELKDFTFLGSDSSNNIRASWKRCGGYNDSTQECYRWDDKNGQIGNAGALSQSITCPPDTKPEDTYPIDSNKDGETDACADPNHIEIVDSCDFSKTHDAFSDYMFNVAVTAQSVCATQRNGSICRYTAVDVGAGHQVYQFDLEGDTCYQSDNQDLIEIPDYNVPDYNYSMGDAQCLSDGGLLTCAEIPENVTDPNTGEVPDGCGTVNGKYACFSGDTDGDEIPDYLDPDIDGDGIANDDDLDADGDGKDDITRPGDGSGSGEGNGGTTVEIDTKGIEQRLDQIKDELKKPLTKVEQGEFDMPAAEQELAEIEQELKDTVENIKEELSNVVTPITGGAGSFNNCYDVAQYRGNKKTTCTDNYSDEVSPIAAAVYFIFVVVAAFILLGGRRND